MVVVRMWQMPNSWKTSFATWMPQVGGNNRNSSASTVFATKPNDTLFISSKKSRIKSAAQTLPAVDDNPHEICRLEDSPFYVYKASGQGLVDVVRKLLDENEERVTAKDNKGWTCLHHAASRGRNTIIDLLLQRGADINVADVNGDTALHIATEKGKRDTVRHLLTKDGIQPNLLNAKSYGALHVATLENKSDIIDELCNSNKPTTQDVFRGLPTQANAVDVNLKGPNGYNCLHLAAALELPECTKKLLQHGCKLSIPCSNGFFPIHMAAKNASSKALDVLLTEGKNYGYTADNMLSGFCDRDQNGPLHSAITSGDFETVNVCLKHGARVDNKQADQATAFHLACSQGLLPIVKLMFEKHKECSPDNAEEILFAGDVREMTPIHKAAMFDHPEIVQYLIDQGGDVDGIDNQRRTPLMLAAIRGGAATIRVLLDANADVALKDLEKRNVLHFLVAYTGRLTDELKSICSTDAGKKLLNQKDRTGCTPLHLASMEGNIRFTDALIDLGATVNPKNNEEQSPLHFAARYGRITTVRCLLLSEAGPNTINEADGKGMTALHISSRNGHSKVVELLLHKGALLHKDYEGRTSFHHAAEEGHIQTMKLLLAFHANLLDQKDKHGNTALHYGARSNQPKAAELMLSYGCVYEENDNEVYPFDVAIQGGHSEVAQAMIQHHRWEEILSKKSVEYKRPLFGLIQSLPEVYKMVLDRSKTTAKCDSALPEYWIKYNFRHIHIKKQQSKEDEAAVKFVDDEDDLSWVTPLCSLNHMVHFGRVELLTHPVCTTYLKMKWRNYGALLYAVQMFFYALFLAALTTSVWFLDPNYSTSISLLANSSNIDMNNLVSLIEDGKECQRLDGTATMMYFLKIPLTYVVSFATANILKETIQIFQEKTNYFYDFVNYTEWALYLTSVGFSFEVLFSNTICHFEWKCAAVAIFLAWLNLLLYLQRLDSVGIYVVMFLEILKTVIRVIAVFSVLFIAFGLTFHILLINDARKSFKSPLMSVIHGVLMMMGSWDFAGVYITPYNEEKLMYPTVNVIFICMFVILMPMLFINMLIGLAVGDIELVLRDATLKRLAMQVEYHTTIEKRLPKWLLKRMDEDEHVVYPNRGIQAGRLIHVWRVVKKIANVVVGSGRASDGQSNEPHDTYSETIFEELDRQKRRLEVLQHHTEKQNDMLRLIVQKMEIHMEADYDDDGMSGVPTSMMQQQQRKQSIVRPQSRRRSVAAARSPGAANRFGSKVSIRHL